MDTSKLQELSTGQKIAAGGGVAAVIASFLPWYVLRDQFIDNVSYRGTDFTFGWMGMVLFAAAAALAVAPAFDKNVGNDQIKGEQIALGAAALGSLFWLFRLVRVPNYFFDVFARGFGLYVAVLAAAAVVTGVLMTMKEKGIPVPKPADFKALQGGVKVTTPADAPTATDAPTPPAPPATAGPTEF